MRAMASMAPGSFLSQPTDRQQAPSMLWALQAVSIESASPRRDTSEYFIASVAIEMPVADGDGAKRPAHGARLPRGTTAPLVQGVEADVGRA